jgi:polyhydroxyalkanoate synthesis regulator phasin
MLDMLKRFALMGIGAISTAEEEIRNVISDLRHKGELSEEEGKKVLAAWRERVAINRREVEELAGKTAQNALKTVGAPAQAEFDALAARVAALEAKLGQEPT